jgi:hypothetical protein
MEDDQMVYGTRIKPFWLKAGTYGYYSSEPELEETETRKTIASGTVLLANWIAAFSVDKVDALLLLPFGFFADGFLKDENYEFATTTLGDMRTGKPLSFTERLSHLFKYRSEAHGFSGVYNVIAGYLAYQVVFNKAGLMPIVGASGTMLGNVLAQMDEDDRLPVNHYAHYGGFTVGILFAFMLSFLKKSTNGVAFLHKYEKSITAFFVSVLLYFKVTQQELPPGTL